MLGIGSMPGVEKEKPGMSGMGQGRLLPGIETVKLGILMRSIRPSTALIGVLMKSTTAWPTALSPEIRPPTILSARPLAALNAPTAKPAILALIGSMTFSWISEPSALTPALSPRAAWRRAL